MVNIGEGNLYVTCIKGFGLDTKIPNLAKKAEFGNPVSPFY